MMPKLVPVDIEFLDSHCALGWEVVDGLKEPPAICYARGYLVKVTRRGYLVAPVLSSTGGCLNAVWVPKVSVTSIKKGEVTDA